MLYNIVDYGAVGDGKTVNTVAIQKAIDACTLTGGRVLVPSGSFITGSLELKSNVDLHLEKGALLKGSDNLEDYNALDAYPQNWDCLDEGWDGKHLIWSSCQENVSISGLGTIDGAGETFFGSEMIWYKGYAWRFGAMKQKPCYEARPGQLIVFCECRDVKVLDVAIQNACSWAVYFHGCDWVQARGITVKNPRYHLNTDGIDIDACSNVTVSDCIIDTGDDAITVRCSALAKLLTPRDVCEHITVTNCVLSSASSCFRIGVGTGTIRHVRVSNIVVKCSGVAIHFNPEWADRSTPTYDVSFTNVTAVNTGRFFAIRANKTEVSDITITNAYAECDNAIAIFSETKGKIKNITLRDINVKPIEIESIERCGLVVKEEVSSLTVENVRVNGELLNI